MINGNIDGLSKAILLRLESLYDMSLTRENFLSEDIILLLSDVTTQINREISIYISRRGEILDVSVGQVNQVSLSDMGLRRSEERLCGIRCIHTHPGGNGFLSGVDINALKALRFDAMVAIGVVDSQFVDAYTGMLNPEDHEDDVSIFGPVSIEQLCSKLFISKILELDKLIKSSVTYKTEGEEIERAILVGVDSDGEAGDSLDELEQLVHTAGAEVVLKTIQNKKNPDPATYIGSGKAQELSLQAQSLNANLAVFDDELTAAQIRNLEDIIGIRVIDRTALILDIFAKRAISHEGKLQVELAQLKYRLPRLVGMGIAMSRLGGGIGTRGPGEKKLETDRRHIRNRIYEIEEDLKKVQIRREALRSRRKKDSVPVVALVGYTNTGKSTLLNTLSGSDVLVEDKLFATLDPTSRKIVLNSGQEVMLIDTVGFINKLPHDLVNAFKSTLEEAVFADLLLHVVDASSPNYVDQMKVVSSVLHSIGADKTVVTVFNKIDKIENKDRLPLVKPCAFISATQNQGLDHLLDAIEDNLAMEKYYMKLSIPYNLAKIVSSIHDEGKIISEEYDENGVIMEVELDKINYMRYKEFKIND